MTADKPCRICNSDRWVCENHRDTAWNDGQGCCGGAAAPCVCSPLFEDSLRRAEAARQALQNLCDTLTKTTVYSGVRYGKTTLAKAINDAYDVLRGGR